MELILTTNSIHLVNTSSNTKINAIDTPSLLSSDYIRYFYLSLGGMYYEGVLGSDWLSEVR